MAHPSRKQLAPVIHQRWVENAKKFTGKWYSKTSKFHERRKRLSQVSKSKAAQYPKFLSRHQMSYSRNFNIVYLRFSATGFTVVSTSKFTSFRRNSTTPSTSQEAITLRLVYGERTTLCVLCSKSFDDPLVHKITFEETLHSACNIKCSSFPVWSKRVRTLYEGRMAVKRERKRAHRLTRGVLYLFRGPARRRLEWKPNCRGLYTMHTC